MPVHPGLILAAAGDDIYAPGGNDGMSRVADGKSPIQCVVRRGAAAIEPNQHTVDTTDKTPRKETLVILLRQFRDADTEALKVLIDTTIDACYTGVYPPAAVSFFKKYHSLECIAEDARAGYTIVVEANGDVIATGTLLGTNVRRMFVSPTAQGRGLGHMMLTRLEQYARETGLTRLDLDASLPAHGFYIRHGYVTDSEGSHTLPHGEELRYYAMSKSLTATG